MIFRSKIDTVSFFDFWSRLRESERDLVATYSAEGGWHQSVGWCHAATLLASAHENKKISEFVASAHEKGARVFALFPYEGDCVLYRSDRYVTFEEQRMILHALSADDLRLFEEEVRSILGRERASDQAVIHSWQYPDISAYSRAFAFVHEKICAGYIYQANLTHKIRAQSDASVRALFELVSERISPRYGGVFQYGSTALISGSPEEFVHIKNGTIRTRPIKGTRPRGKSPIEDKRNRDELLHSSKEKAELAMIVDLLRNDIGKVSEIGSVAVEIPREISALSGVFHAYAVITGRLAVSPVEAVLSMIPGGSISGVPKQEALQIIAEVESESRGPYTGVFGYFDPDGSAHFSILIRTLEKRANEIALGVGGGIVFDSNAEDEYAETITKALPFIRHELVSERLEREHGTLVFKVLQQDGSERVSAFYRKKDMMPLTYHVVRFGTAAAAVPEIHAAILQGGKIGETFKQREVDCAVKYFPRTSVPVEKEIGDFFATQALMIFCERIEYRVKGELYASISDYFNPELG